MRRLKVILSLFALGVSLTATGQVPTEKNWSIISGYEANYFGNNIGLQFRKSIRDKHIIDIGASYNLSDGFSDRPVLGIDLDYRYIVAHQNKWNSSLGVSYRRQKPLEIVNIQAVNLIHSVDYAISKKISLQSTIGYGVAVERSASARQFSQFNSLSGSFSLKCVYQLF